ncbi:Crp/Fnr family transcriptional regulator [Actinomadura flavalba]|uniref:Crp/Fnr family transcriptional regulator n=1 Tax=Actinomadura flavalba TaxID=1120938 RepID=UPI0003A3717D|nr:Crp/Fnr family transcriptional regulator [Actinomadura flavalba]
MDGLLSEKFVREGVECRFRPGAVLLRQGDPPSHVLHLSAGRVKVTRLNSDGSTLLLAVRGPGELLGEIAVLGGTGRSATVTAVDPCRARTLPADRFRVLVREIGAEGELLARAMRRMLESEAWRAETAALPAGPRVVRALLRLAGPGDGRLEVPLGQAELGLAAGLARGVVAAELAVLRKAGLVVTERRRVLIADAARLRAWPNRDSSVSDF